MSEDVIAQIEDSNLVDNVQGPIGVPDTYLVTYKSGLDAAEQERMNELGFTLDLVAPVPNAVQVHWEEVEDEA